MLAPITIRYPFRAVRRSLATAEVCDLFGVGEAEPPHVVADNFTLDIRPGEVVLFTGASGSGKSSLMRAVGEQLHAVDAMSLTLPDLPLVDALPGTIEERLGLLAACGLGEARLMLRTPSELSDGQRYRFRVAFAAAEGERRDVSPPVPNPTGGLTSRRSPILLDEFAAVLGRTLAKVLAFNVRKLASRTGVGVLCATTHDDLTDDLNPDVFVRCHGDGVIDVTREPAKKRAISFADQLWLSDGTAADWPHFARWHYRSHHLACVRRVILLWHGDEPIGICVFSAPAAAVSLRTRFFKLTNPRSEIGMRGMNANLWLLQRVVLHPTYRGAGIAAAFVRRACELCPVDWIETLTAMGRVNPFFERAGFVRVGTIRKRDGSRPATPDTHPYSEPAYYVRDNRRV